MSSSQIYTEIIFDLGNVIIDLDITRSEQLFFELTGIHFMEASDEDLMMFYRFETGMVSEALFLNYFIGKSKKPIHANELVHAWNAMLVSIPWSRLGMMQQLRNKYRISILSNTNETHLRWVGKYMKANYQLEDLSTFADHIFYSNKVHLRKPDPQIYHHMLNQLEQQGKNCLFFDDNPLNIKAAKELGINGVLVKPGDEIEELIQLSL